MSLQSRGSCNNIIDLYAKLCVSDVVKDIKLINVNVDEMQVFVIISKVRIKINVDVNVKNWLTKEYVTKDLFGILVIVNVNVINHVILENI